MKSKEVNLELHNLILMIILLMTGLNRIIIRMMYQPIILLSINLFGYLPDQVHSPIKSNDLIGEMVFFTDKLSAEPEVIRRSLVD